MSWRAIDERLAARLREGLVRARGRRDGVATQLRVQILIVEDERHPGRLEVPDDVLGEHADEEVGADALLEPVVDGTNQEVHALEGPERALHMLQRLVGPRDIGVVEFGLAQRCTDDVDPVHLGFCSDGGLVHLEREVRVRDVENDVLGHVVLVDHLADPHPDGFSSHQLAVRDHALDLLEFLAGRAEHLVALVGTKAAEDGVPAGHQSLPGKVRVGEGEQVALVEQAHVRYIMRLDLSLKSLDPDGTTGTQ